MWESQNDVLKSLDNRVEYYKVIVLWLLLPLYYHKRHKADRYENIGY